MRAGKHADRKVLVFTSFTSQAHVLAEAFGQAGGHPDAIALHTFDMTPADRDSEVSRFNYCSECQVMIADNSAAEGRNFQMVDELMFLDLPLSPNALEQRIGRVDRFNLRAKPGGTRCAYLAEEGSPWALGLAAFPPGCRRGLRQVRRHTPAAPGELGERVADQLLSGGFEAFNIPAAEAEQLMADERIEQDLLSEIEDSQFFTDFSDASFDDLLRFEDSPKTVEDAFRRLRRPGGIGIQVLTWRATPTCLSSGCPMPGWRPWAQCRGTRHDQARFCRGSELSTSSSPQRRTMSGRSASAIRSSTGWLAICGGDERGRAIAMVTRTEHVTHAQLWVRLRLPDRVR